MSWLGRGAVGLGLMIAGLAAFGFGLYHLAKTGSCASGGPYVSARPCPSGTGLWIGALIVGVFVFIGGGAVFASRGRPSTDPGLPPADDSLSSNPPPFSRFYGPN
jgi:hypothetical protein